MSKVLITAGGTGGHIYPAQGLAQQLKQHAVETLFVAGGLSSNRYFERSLFAYREVACSPIFSKHPLKAFKGVSHLVKGTYESLRIIKSYNPLLVIGFGSYYTLPILLAAKLSKTPFVLHEANSIPGKANQWFAPHARCVGVHFPSTKALLKGKTLEVGMPLRAGYYDCSLSKAEGRAHFQLDTDRRTLLIFGGSQGAKGINDLIQVILQKNQLPFQVIHLTGQEESVEKFKLLYKQAKIPACVKPFEPHMNKAWKAADFFIGRAGAATIAEAMEFEVPGVLIPYPFATENHQEKNADFLVDLGGAIKLIEGHLTPFRLLEALQLIEEQADQMRLAMQMYKINPARIDLCQLVLNLMEKK
jgi:UDP-N-acetylglucosamine--N-acetylmuramyl-(pentapeptide) pyrophosphoryl-undecaprenol N-acetylglucosamine transferase